MPTPSSPAKKVSIAVRPLGSRDGKIVLLPPEEISYAFIGSATPKELWATHFNSNSPPEPRRVYVRTFRGVGKTKFRRLAEFRRALGPVAAGYFFSINPACIVNAHKITALYPCDRMLEFVALEGQKEVLEVSRRAWPALRVWLGLAPKKHDSGAASSTGGE